MKDLPLIMNIGFITTTLLTFYLFYNVLKKSKSYSHLKIKISVGLLIWLLAQYFIASSEFYINNTDSTPPAFLLAFVPTLFFILILFVTKKGKRFIDSLPLLESTYLHVVRIPVELILYGLALYKTIPELMTFAGRNYDILAGISAPFIAYFGITKKLLNRRFLIVWNLISMALLLFIIVNAILSAPFSFQQFAFEQPNIAVFYFPYVWLPAFIVPIVLFCHLVSIRLLTNKKSLSTNY